MLFNNKNEKLELGIIAGVTYSNYFFKSDELPYFKMLENEKFKSQITPLYGIFLNYYFVPYEKVFSFNTNAYYSTYTGEAEDDNYILNLDFSFIKISPSLKISTDNENTNFFGNIGITTSIILKDINTIYFKRYEDYDPMFNTSIKDYVLGFNVGIGISYKTISLEYRFETGNGISRATNVKNNSFTQSILLSYSFL